MDQIKQFHGRLAVVTGASRGLGRAMALALAAEGAMVALVARDEARLASVKSEIEAQGGKAAVLVGDVTNEDDVRKMEEEITRRLGRVQILINNAGTNIRHLVEDFPLQEWRSVIDASLIHSFLMSRAFVPHMKGSGYGRILNLGSIMSHVSLPERTAYSSAKAGLLGFTRSLALELAPHGITVNAISPGPFATEMTGFITENPELHRQFVSQIPVGRFGKVDEIGALAVYLCSEAAGFITGTDILIDGGWTAK